MPEAEVRKQILSGRCWPKVASELGIFSVGFGEISWFWKEKFSYFGFDGINLSKADPQNAFTSGSYRPIRDTSALAKSLSQWSLFPSAANKARLVLSFKCQKQNAARYQTNACL